MSWKQTSLFRIGRWEDGQVCSCSSCLEADEDGITQHCLGRGASAFRQEILRRVRQVTPGMGSAPNPTPVPVSCLRFPVHGMNGQSKHARHDVVVVWSRGSSCSHTRPCQASRGDNETDGTRALETGSRVSVDRSVVQSFSRPVEMVMASIRSQTSASHPSGQPGQQLSAMYVVASLSRDLHDCTDDRGPPMVSIAADILSTPSPSMLPSHRRSDRTMISSFSSRCSYNCQTRPDASNISSLLN